MFQSNKNLFHDQTKLCKPVNDKQSKLVQNDDSSYYKHPSQYWFATTTSLRTLEALKRRVVKCITFDDGHHRGLISTNLLTLSLYLLLMSQTTFNLRDKAYELGSLSRNHEPEKNSAFGTGHQPLQIGLQLR